MKKLLICMFVFVLTVFSLPLLVYLTDGITKADVKSTEEGDAVTCGTFDADFKITVYNKGEDKLFEVNFEEYLIGVIAGEMPPTYETEALKAQAVAARSYILSKIADYMEGKTADGHKGAMVCTDYQHCNAWQDIGKIKNGWDTKYADEYEKKIRNAVRDTQGEYMTYDNKVVKAYFYAISCGRTENVEEVWATSLPYLRSVPSREDIGSDGFESQKAYPKDLFVSKLRSADNNVSIAELKDCIGKIKRTEGGSVSQIEIGGVNFEGKQIRDIFKLRSTAFEIETEGDKVTFKVKGYGHGVGMSQNGANVMAKEGKTYTEILKHYYTGANIVNLYKKS